MDEFASIALVVGFSLVPAYTWYAGAKDDVDTTFRMISRYCICSIFVVLKIKPCFLLSDALPWN